MNSKRTIWLVGLMMAVSAVTVAQAPLGINYQGVARSADGSPLINQVIGLRISITSGPDGSADYSEEHHPETNEFGLFAVVIGQGQSSGSIGAVDWAAGNKWLQIEIDPQDNSNYMLVGTQQMMSVPYALYAGNATALTPGYGIAITNGQINNVLPDQVVNLTGTGATTITGTYPNFTINSTDNVDDADADPTNEIELPPTATANQVLKWNGTAWVAGPDDTADGDADTTNELQTISRTGTTVTLSNSGGSFSVDDADADPTNEIELPPTATANQVLKWNGTAWVAGPDDTADGDTNPANEYNTAGSFAANNTLRITDGGGNVDVPLGPLNANLDAGNQRVANLADPVNPQDAVNLQYLEAKDATDYAFKTNISDTGTGAPLTFDLSAVDFDDGALISGTQIQITETGVYLFSIQGTSTNNASLVINVNNSIDYPVDLINLTRYYDAILLKLNAGDIVELRATSTTSGEAFTLEFFGYKI